MIPKIYVLFVKVFHYICSFNTLLSARTSRTGAIIMNKHAFQIKGKKYLILFKHPE